MNRDATGLRLQHTHSFVFIYKNAFTILQTITFLDLEQVTDRATITVDSVDSAVQGKTTLLLHIVVTIDVTRIVLSLNQSPVSTVSYTHFSLPQFS